MSKGPSETYRLVWRAARARRQITCIYEGRYREVCPTIVGYQDEGQEAVFVFQFGGKSGGKLPNWRCLTLAKVTDLRVREGPWHGGSSHGTTQTCIRWVDVDVNIPETLKHRAPVPFGSPKLRPPRRSGE